MTLKRSKVQAHAHALVPSTSRVHLAALLLIPVALVALTACGRDDRRGDELLRADLAAAAQAPSMRQQYASPQELGYPGAAPGYPTPYGAPPQYGYPAPYGYPQPYPQQYPQGVVYQQPAPAPRVVYRTRPASGGSSGGGGGAGSGAGTGAGSAPSTERNTTRGAVIGAATGAAVGIATSRDKVKGGAVGAVAGAVLGGVVGSQIYTKPRRN
jgi:hypothetical protein